MSEAAIILISHDSRGLGSFRRQCNISSALHDQSPNTPLYLATSCIHMASPPYLRVLRLPNWAETQARSRLLLRYVQEYMPKALLVDKHPFGVNRDFLAALEWACDQNIACFYGLRDILDHPDRVRAEWLGMPPYIARYFRKVLVYGQENVFDVTQYGLDREQLEYCGYVSLTTPVQKSQRGILCTVGGGDSGLATHVSRLFWNCDLKDEKTLVTGPFNNLTFQAKERHRHIPYHPDMPQLWATHHTVVCMGGYNTIIEAIFYGLHVVCIPRIEPRLEQLLRAQIFADRGWLLYIHPAGLTAETLQRAVAQGPPPQGRPDLMGAQRAAATILHEISLYSEVVS
jgi:predicted glycosyltransferase